MKTTSRYVTPVHPASADGSGARRAAGPAAQFKRQLAGLPYVEQCEMVQPPPRYADAGSTAAEGAVVQHKVDGTGTAVQREEEKPTSTTETSTVKYKWMTKQVDGETVHYLVEHPEGDVPLGPVQKPPPGMEFYEGLENKVRAFEITVGALAEGHPASIEAATAVARACMEITSNFFMEVGDVEVAEKKGTETIKKIAEFGNVVGGESPVYAGNIGTDAAEILALLGQGNVRECMTVASNFVSNFAPAFIAAKGKDSEAVATFLATLEPEQEELKNRLKQMSETDKYLITSERVNAIVREQGEIREGVKRDTQSPRTIGDLRAELGLQLPLSEAEMKLMGIDTTVTISREELDAKRLKFGEGIRSFVVKEYTDTSKKLRAAAVPLGAGSSGTTARLMEIGRLLGYDDPVKLRAACIGYIIPLRSHTLWEIMRGATAAGGPPVEQSLAAFFEIEPFGSGETIYPVPEFWDAVRTHMARG